LIRINPRDLALSGGFEKEPENYVPIPVGSLEGILGIKSAM